MRAAAITRSPLTSATTAPVVGTMGRLAGGGARRVGSGSLALPKVSPSARTVPLVSIPLVTVGRRARPVLVDGTPLRVPAVARIAPLESKATEAPLVLVVEMGKS